MTTPAAMNDEERDALLQQGFSAPVVELLKRLLFRPAGHVTLTHGLKVPRFLRQAVLPHVEIALDRHAEMHDLVTAIFDAGRHDGHAALAALFNSFTDRARSKHAAPAAADLERRVAELEAKLAGDDPSSATDREQP